MASAWGCRGALPTAAARPQSLRRRLLAAWPPAAAAAAARQPPALAGLAQQLRQLKQLSGWAGPCAAAQRGAQPAARGGRAAAPARQPAGTGAGGAPVAGAGRRPGVVWFRGDLRLHDHEALARAQAECSSLLPVYCFDPRDYARSPQGYHKTGPFRAAFLAEAVSDLRAALRAAGSELLVRLGRPEDVIGELVRRTGAGAVYCHTEVSYEDLRTQAAVQQAAEAAGASLHASWGNTLAHLDDLPFELHQLPQNFDKFRAGAERVVARAALPAPTELRSLPLGGRLEPGDIPTLRQLGLPPLPPDAAAGQPGEGGGQRGGEGEALRQLRGFLAAACGGAGTACASSFSSAVAPWLAAGCLSPRRMLQEAAAALGAPAASGAPTAAAGAGPVAGADGAALTWVRFELLWRDFFRFLAYSYSSRPSARLGAGATAPTPVAVPV